MAALQKIRNKGALLMIVVGLALFAFIAEEFFRSINSYFGMMVNLKSFNLRFYFASMVNSLFIFPDCSFSKCCVGRL